MSEDEIFERWLRMVNDTVMTEGRYFTIDADHNVLPCHDILEWGRCMQNAEARIVGHTGNRRIWVSTVFLGLDHDFTNQVPMVFETMVFRDGQSEEMEQYPSWKTAEAGHKRMCAKVLRKAGVKARAARGVG